MRTICCEDAKNCFTVCVFYQFIMCVFRFLRLDQIIWWWCVCVCMNLLYKTVRSKTKLDAVGFSPFAALFSLMCCECEWICVCVCVWMHSEMYWTIRNNIYTNYMAQTINDCLIKLLNRAKSVGIFEMDRPLYLRMFFHSSVSPFVTSQCALICICVKVLFVCVCIIFALLWINRHIENTFVSKTHSFFLVSTKKYLKVADKRCLKYMKDKTKIFF